MQSSIKLHHGQCVSKCTSVRHRSAGHNRPEYFLPEHEKSDSVSIDVFSGNYSLDTFYSCENMIIGHTIAWSFDSRHQPTSWFYAAHETQSGCCAWNQICKGLQVLKLITIDEYHTETQESTRLDTIKWGSAQMVQNFRLYCHCRPDQNLFEQSNCMFWRGYACGHQKQMCVLHYCETALEKCCCQWKFSVILMQSSIKESHRHRVLKCIRM